MIAVVGVPLRYRARCLRAVRSEGRGCRIRWASDLTASEMSGRSCERYEIRIKHDRKSRVSEAPRGSSASILKTSSAFARMRGADAAFVDDESKPRFLSTIGTCLVSGVYITPLPSILIVLLRTCKDFPSFGQSQSRRITCSHSGKQWRPSRTC